ncbi:MAG: HAE1 family hydrophobic/amphiphilic exporter-1 [Mariniblastus sp.]|jgi:HAE1 family hydrophobic/amphiphilic exporter-1
MKSVIRWAIRNSPAMNTFLIASMIVGAISMIVMRREVFPNFALEIVLVSVPFPGATPEETEDGICQKIESAVANLDGVKKMTSVAMESFGYVILELDGDVKDVQKVLNDVRSAIEQVSSFPPNAEDPDVKQIVFRAPAISVGILAPTRARPPTLQEEIELRELAEEIRSDLLEIRPVPPRSFPRRMFSSLFQPKGPAVSSAEIVAARPYEISVEVSEDSLRQYGLSLQSIAQIIRQQNADTPGGTMEMASQEMLLRGNNKRETGTEIAKLPLKTPNGNGSPITVGEVGTVIDGFAETSSAHTINGRQGLVVRCAKTAEEDLFTVVGSVRNYVSKRKMPVGYSLETWGDVSVDVRDRMELLTRNGLQGLLFVFIVLAVFLDLRLAFWVAMGIPVSILGAGFILLMTGQTLNMLTMFAFLMALGIVVDDAIVIGENIYAKRQEGMNYVKAAVEGTTEVLPAVCASVATTIIAFMPLMYVTGVMGKFISIMPIAVIAMLVISLVESTFILPAHLSHDENLFTKIVGLILYALRPLTAVFTFVNRKASSAMEWGIEKLYQPMLFWSLRHKRIVLSLVGSVFVFAIGLISAGIVPFALMPSIDGREISATVAFPNGSPEQFSIAAVDELESAFHRVNEKIKAETGGIGVIKNLYRRIGEVGDSNMGPTGVTNGSHVGSVEVQLTPAADRSYTTEDLNELWREQLPKIAGTEVLKFGSQSMGPGGVAIEFKILSDDKGVEYLDQATEECKEYLAKQFGVFDIEDDSRLGKMEKILRLNELGRSLGMNEATLATTIRAGYFGEEVMRLQRGRHEVKLMVRYPREARENMEDFEQIRIRDGNGVEWPLLEIAEVDERRAYSEINRLDQRRSVTVSANVNAKKGNARKIIADMRSKFVPDFVDRYREQYNAGVSINWEGEQAQNDESVASMGSGFVVALLCMFVLLTLQFRSYVQPAIILAIIPFGWLGAIFGHWIMDINLTLFSFFGLIALTGVVVNDSIVLVDFINRRVREGIPLFDALMSAGKRRFRPIMLTSFTTVAGLCPMLFETSMQAQVLIPMAVSLVFGLITGTLLILILVPVFYHIYGSMLQYFGMPLYHDDDELDDKDYFKSEKRPEFAQEPRELESVLARQNG